VFRIILIDVIDRVGAVWVKRERLLAMLIGVGVYAYAGYPALVWLIGTLRPRPVRKGTDSPSMSVIIAAYNEAAILPQKLDSIATQEYPQDQIEVLVASDGSSDDTPAVVAQFEHLGVRLLALERGGKARALNRAAAEARNDVLVFTDANAILSPGALRALAANLCDPSVGCVGGNEKRQPPSSNSAAGLGERSYWEYDKRLKQAETRVGSMVAASGSLYAIRRSLFRPVKDFAATDDFSISTQAVRAGYRLVFEADAVTWEPTAPSGEVEFGRKTRITIRGMRSVWGARDLLSPFNSGFFAMQLLSHKVIRRLVGFSAAGVLVVSLTLVDRRRYRMLLAGQLVFYGLAVVGWLGQQEQWGRKPWLYIPYYACMSNLAVMLGVVQFIRQRRLEIWEPRRED
jgi:cellulose synthase/poly-beta-1,6-N-acetylglucosamine synthase-like glycosyltransferase